MTTNGTSSPSHANGQGCVKGRLLGGNSDKAQGSRSGSSGSSSSDDDAEQQQQQQQQQQPAARKSGSSGRGTMGVHVADQTAAAAGDIRIDPGRSSAISTGSSTPVACPTPSTAYGVAAGSGGGGGLKKLDSSVFKRPASKCYAIQVGCA